MRARIAAPKLASDNEGGEPIAQNFPCTVADVSTHLSHMIRLITLCTQWNAAGTGEGGSSGSFPCGVKGLAAMPRLLASLMTH